MHLPVANSSNPLRGPMKNVVPLGESRLERPYAP